MFSVTEIKDLMDAQTFERGFDYNLKGDKKKNLGEKKN